MVPTAEGCAFNPFDPSFWADPYSFYPALLAGPPRPLALLFPTIVVTRYKDVLGALRDGTRFSSCVPQLPFIAALDPFEGAPTLLFSDPPVHTRLRRLVTPYFRASKLRALRVRIQAIADGLLDGIAAKGEFDGVADLAGPLPDAINAEMLGIPVEDQPMLKTWWDTIFASVRSMLAIAGTPAGSDALSPTPMGVAGRSAESPLPPGAVLQTHMSAMAALREYLIRVIERRRAHRSDDLVSVLVAAYDRESLSREELLALILLLLFAGGETTTSLIANALLALSRHRDQLERLASAPALIPTAVEEVLRYDSPVQMVMRYATGDTRLGGTFVPAGAAMLLMLGAANRDPAHFPTPERFDVGREPNRHVAFGEGIHACIGSRLARLQGRVVLAAMLERFPRFRLRTPEAPLHYSGSLLSRGLTGLPLTTD